MNNYEADDIISSIVKHEVANNYYIDIISNDKDLLQLLNDNIKILSPKKGMSDFKIITISKFKSEYKLLPYQIPDLKGLMGDVSDNLPGIKGIGKKNALMLLQKYQTLENIIKNVNNLKPSISKLIKINLNNGIICKKLSKLNINLPITGNLNNFIFNINNLNNKKVLNFYNEYNMKTLLKKKYYFKN